MTSDGTNIKMDMRSPETKLKEMINALSMISEKHRLVVLHESLTRSNVLTSSMVSALDSFERKLQTLDELVTPVYDATNETGLLLNNVDRSLSLVDSILHYYDIYGALTPAISAGPGGNYIGYLAEMNRLEEAVKYFNSITAARERERVTQLFDTGRKQLLEECERLIARYANPLTPKELIDLCESPNNKNNEIHPTHETDMNAIRCMIDWFNAHGFRQGLIDTYAVKKGTMIRRSLQLLAEHLNKTSVRRISTNSTGTNPPNLSNIISGTDTLKRHKKKLSDASRAIIRTPTNATLGRSLSTATSIIGNPTDEGEIDMNDDRLATNYKCLLDALLLLLQRERFLLNYVFPQQLQTNVFNKMIELPLVYMREEGVKLCQSIEKLSHKLDEGKFVIYGIFAILKWFFQSRMQFAKLNQDGDSNRRAQFAALSEAFQQSAVNCLRAVLDEIRTDSSLISQGGNVHPMTSHVLGFMEGLLEHEEIVILMASLYFQQHQSTSSGGSSGKDKGLYDLGNYYAQLISSLYDNLSKKNDALPGRSDPLLRTIFLLNNINYLLKRLEKSPILPILQRYEPNIRAKYETQFQNQLKEYTKFYEPITQPIHQLLEYDNTQQIPETKIHDRDREKIKETFTAVNTAIDTLIQLCQTYIIADVDLGQQLRREGKLHVLESFKKFYEKFNRKDFTKHRDKYVRYHTQQLETMIDKLF